MLFDELYIYILNLLMQHSAFTGTLWSSRISFICSKVSAAGSSKVCRDKPCMQVISIIKFAKKHLGTKSLVRGGEAGKQYKSHQYHFGVLKIATSPVTFLTRRSNWQSSSMMGHLPASSFSNLFFNPFRTNREGQLPLRILSPLCLLQ